jgi:hypothetical protein
MSNKYGLGDLEMLEQASAKSAVNTALAEAKPTARSKVSNGKSLFLQPDGRSRTSRRFRDIAAAIASDLGGVDGLSEGQKQLVRRCALVSVECEKMEARSVEGKEIDLDLFGALTDRLGRCLQRIGLKRVPKLVLPPV